MSTKTTKKSSTSKLPKPTQESTPAADYDGSYRRLFAERAMVVDLLRSRYMPQTLVRSLDLEREFIPLNLNHPLPKERSAGEKKKEGDVAYKIQHHTLAGEPSHHTFLMFEFQSSTHLRMDVRMLVYAGLIWLQADRLKKNRPDWAEPLGDPPSPVLPIVIYNGKDTWTPPSSLRDRIPIHRNPKLKALQPDMGYLLLDIRRLAVPRNPKDLQTFTDVLFALESLQGDSSPLAGILNRLKELLGTLPQHQQQGLREAFRDFIVVVARASKIKLVAGALTPLENVMINLVETITTSIENSRAEGRAEGRTENSSAMIAAFLKLQGEALTKADMERLSAHINSQALTASMIEATPREAVLQWAKGSPAPRTPRKATRKKS